MDKHANSHISQTLLRMFFALTSPNYDTQKGIKKVRYFKNSKIFL